MRIFGRAVTAFAVAGASLGALASLAVPVAAVAQTPAAPTLADYGRLPDFQDMSISADGNRIAMIVRVDGERAVLVKQSDAYIKRFAIGDVKVRGLSWAGNDHLIVSTSKTEDLVNFNVDQAEFTQTLVVPMNGGDPWTIFAKQRKMFSSTFGLYGTRVIGGRPYFFTGGIAMEKDKDSYETFYRFRGGAASLYRVDLTDQSIKRINLAPRDDTTRRWLVDGTGQVGAMIDVDRGSGSYAIRNGAGDVLTRGRTETGRVGLTAFGRSGDTVIYRQLGSDDPYYRYFEVPLAGGTPTEILADIDFDGLYISGKNERLTGYYTETVTDIVKRNRVLFDPERNAKVARIAKAFPKYTTSIQSATGGYERAIVRIEGNQDSGSWFDVNLDQLSASALGYERPAITPEFVGKVSMVTYAAADGLEIDAVLTLPPGKEPTNLPVIIMPHGGPTSEDKSGFHWHAQAYASRGYAVLQPNFRGSTNRDREFVRAGYGEWGRKMQTDLSDGLAYLATKGIADPDRACIVGISYGGYAATAGVTLQQGIYRCAVSINGVSDVFRMVDEEEEQRGDNELFASNLAREIGEGRDLKQVSPRRFADQADAPILLIHGKDDTVVAHSQSFAMADALKDAGKPHEFVTLEGEDHYLSGEETRMRMLSSAVAFVEKHNPPD